MIRRRHTPLLVLVLGFCLLAWSVRFVQDDAFITWRYSRALVEGHGLSFNPGEFVEGYTNFLWAVLMAGGMALGLNPIPTSQVLGILCFGSGLLAVGLALERLSRSMTVALAGVLLMGANASYLRYATGGLETPLQAAQFAIALSLTAVGLHQERLGRAALAALSTLWGLSLLTHPDSGLLPVVTGPFALWILWRQRHDTRGRALDLVALIAPAALLVAPWLIWKYQVYGDLLPNTAYAKTGAHTSLARGGFFVYYFLHSYFLLPVLALLSPRLPGLLSRRGRPIWPALLLLPLWLAYVVRVGGGFMEFRLLMPVWPAFALLLAGLLFGHRWDPAPVRSSPPGGWGSARPALPAWLVIGFLLIGSVHHALAMDRVNPSRGIETVEGLVAHLYHPGSRWVEVGQALSVLPAGEDGVYIATKASGAIPYYAGLRTLDLHGLTDHWTARHGEVVSDLPGHQKLAPPESVVERGVHLLVGRTQVTRLGRLPADRRFSRATWFPRWMENADGQDFPEALGVIEIPMAPRHALLLLYLRQHPAIDAQVASGAWQQHPLVP